VPFAALLPHIDPGTPLYGIQARGLLGPAELPSTLAEMAEDYIEQIRGIQPTGPYRLLGWCFGGRVAYEMACLLRKAGQEVGLVALMDAYPPGDEPLPDAESMLVGMLTPASADEADPELAALCRLPLDFPPLREYLRKTSHPLRNFSEQEFSVLFGIFRNGTRLHHTPMANRFDGDIVCFGAVHVGSGGGASAEEWRPYIGGAITEHRIACRSADMLGPDRVREMAELLDAAMSREQPL
jgi:thioesterase domain-containing protein